ncbi:MAG: Smr/MutS family protein, partial [Polyangiaceae bacterium]|nr:Smr/MutS family protein [Polyangiaceae bacterium]
VDRKIRSVEKPPSSANQPLAQVGDSIRMKGFHTPAEVIGILPKGQLRVQAGVMKMTVSPDDIAQVLGKNKPATKPHPKKKRRSSDAQSASQVLAPVRTQDTTLDLRGVRVEEGLERLDTFIDEILRRQESGAFVLHGHGTGAMKEATRQHLRAHRAIRDSRAAERDEGGDAFTLFFIRDA